MEEFFHGEQRDKNCVDRPDRPFIHSFEREKVRKNSSMMVVQKENGEGREMINA